MSIQIVHSDRHEDAKWIHDNLYEYNLRKTGEERVEIILEPDAERNTLLAVREDGVRLGGCCWHIRKEDHFVFVDFLWMSDTARGTGCGSALLQTVENEAKNAGCCGVSLGTNTFQSPGFYQKMGYTVIQEEKRPMKNCPENIHYVFRKTF